MIYPTISIRQPWSECIINPAFGKDVENRTWALPRQFIGRTVLIHAGKKVDANTGYLSRAVSSANERLNTGGIVGVLVFSCCVQNSGSKWAEEGFFHWQIAKAIKVEFFPCGGQLGFFSVDYPYEVQL